jgi:hypothetical protein
MDELIDATSITMPDSARRDVPVPALARWPLGLAIAATLAANVAHCSGNDLAGATVTASQAVALAGSYELLMMIIRSAAGPPEQSAQPRETHDLRHERAFSVRDSMHKYSDRAAQCWPTAGPLECRNREATR